MPSQIRFVIDWLQTWTASSRHETMWSLGNASMTALRTMGLFPCAALRRMKTWDKASAMRRTFRYALASAFAATLMHSQTSWSEPYAAEDAASHVGEIGTVCGLVVSSKFAIRSKGQLTFLNLDRPHPDHVFTVVIWGKDRPKFG